MFWTHNDSGDSARIFAINSKGENLATFDVSGAEAADWEDMASVVVDGKSFLVIGDVGYNGLPTYNIYIVPEPSVNPAMRAAVGTVSVARRLKFKYEDEPQNCEAVAVDPTDGTIYLVNKVTGMSSKVYSLREEEKNGKGLLTAKVVAEILIWPVVAMDISADGLRAVVLTYGTAYEYVRSHEETWREAFLRPPTTIAIPGAQGGESICFGPKGLNLYLTWEGVHTPLWHVPALIDTTETK